MMQMMTCSTLRRAVQRPGLAARASSVLAAGSIGKAIMGAGSPLPPAPLGAVLGSGAVRFELFLDPSCPFSCKAFETVYDQVEPAHRGRASFLVHNVVQPWHAHSTLLHEAALAVRQLAPERYFQFWRALCAGYETFTNEALRGETRAQTAQRLAALAESSCALPAATVFAMLEHSGKGNAGCALTQEIKWACKHHRGRGVHVTPTVILHGLEATDINSGWTAEQWGALIDEVRAAHC